FESPIQSRNAARPGRHLVRAGRGNDCAGAISGLSLSVRHRTARRPQAVRPRRSAPPSLMLGTMFVRYFVELDLPFDLADRALLHRVAEATIKDFVDRVGQALHGRLTRQSA